MLTIERGTDLSDDILRSLLDIGVTAAREAGELVHRRIGGEIDVQFKAQGNYNLVTEMDLASETLIKRIISEKMSEPLFLAEEGGGSEELDHLTWVIDPIDGTVNYAHGIPIYCVSIAAVVGKRPVVGVIYNPGAAELFTAVRGGGAQLNGQPISVSTTPNVQKSVLVTGFPYNVAENPFGCIDSFVEIIGRGIPVRRLGSAALDLAYVAAGRFDAFWEVALNMWDLAAGVLMVDEAGGRVGSYAPNDTDELLVVDRIIASNGLLHDQMREILLRPETPQPAEARTADPERGTNTGA